MNVASVSIFIGVIACGVVATGARAHAQTPGPQASGARTPTAQTSSMQTLDAPNIAGGETMPWNRGVTVETRIAAREAFLEGNRLFKIPLFSQAVEKYTDALGKWKHPAFYFNLALAEINLGQYLEAREDLERALKYGEAPLRVDRFVEAKKQLVEVERHLGRLRVTCATPGAEVTLDGVVLFTAPGNREVWIKAQAHQVIAKQDGYGTQAKRVTVIPGARETVDLSLRQLVEDRPWAAWKPWAVMGVGVGLAAAGGALHALSARDFEAYDSGFVKLDCAARGCTEAEIDAGDSHLSDRLDRARLEKKLGFGGYIAGGVVFAAGVALLYMNRPHLMEQEDAGPRSTGVAIVPVVSPDMVGVTMTLRH